GYTGSAGWLYRVALEDILGFRLRGDKLRLAPCIPAHWPGYEITYRYRTATYHVTVENPHGLERGAPQITVDGRPLAADAVELVDDRPTRAARAALGKHCSRH